MAEHVELDPGPGQLDAGEPEHVGQVDGHRRRHPGQRVERVLDYVERCREELGIERKRRAKEAGIDNDPPAPGAVSDWAKKAAKASGKDPLVVVGLVELGVVS